MRLTQLFGLAVAILIVNGCDNTPRPVPSSSDRAKQGRALWEEKCRTVAGARIYRTVENVEGIVLTKIRPKISGREWADPLWPGAAFADEAQDEDYIISFLGYEEAIGADGKIREISTTRRGYISRLFKSELKMYPGYRYVDTPDGSTGKYLRHRLEPKKKEGSKIGWIDMVLDRSVEEGTNAKYAVTYEDEVNTTERAVGVANSTVRVVEISTGEVLGEFRRFAWSVPPSSSNPNPWLTARKCPGEAVGADATTRKFVDQVLIPARER